MITNPAAPTSEHNGLITYVLRQLIDSTIYMFQKYIRDLHVDYQEAKLGNITVTKLLLQIEDKIRVLKHAGEWTEADSAQPAAMALAAGTKLPPQLEEILSKQIKAQLTQLIERNKSLQNNHTTNTNMNKNGFVHQEWMFIPPSTPGETRHYNNKTFTWCTKCRQGKGQWVSAHDSNTHVEGFRPTPRRFNNTNGRQQRNGILKNGSKKDLNNPSNTNTNKAHVSFTDGHTNMIDLSQDGILAQLSLQDGITSCFNLPDVMIILIHCLIRACGD
jgi:hypothetical protein